MSYIYPAVLLASVATVCSVNAQILAIQTAEVAPGPGPGGFAQNYGWTFTVGASPISVAQLGIYDHAPDGLAFDHPIGIWNFGGDLLTSATVPSGTEASLIGSYRFVDTEPVTLAANTLYYIGAWSPETGDQSLYDTPQTVASEITYGQHAYSPGGSLQWPELTFNPSPSPGQGILGPNFTFTVVPEPHEYALFTAAALVGFFGWRRTRERRAA